MIKSLESDKILSELNPAQQEAVKQIEGPVLIVAGAGSGKTRVLTHKIAYLIECGVPPKNILALTFTNKAAQVMKERISKLINFEASKQVWAGTFHSLFARILRFEANLLGYSSNFSIYDTDDSANIIKRILNSYNLNTKFTPENVHRIISLAKNRVISPEEFSRNATTPAEKIIANLYYEYQSYLQKNNAMDFDDLLVNTYEMFNSFPDVLDKYQERFTFILVDEYQDTNRVQYLVLKQLSSKYRNITVVGDDSQSIYRWRGADIRNILEFQKDFPDAKVIRLEQNYRSTKNIISAADSLIKHNRNRIDKTLWTDNEEGELISLFPVESEKKEASFVVDQIKKLCSEKGYRYQDIAVLYRINAQSLEFENALRRENIDYIVVGGISFYKRKEIKDVLAYLRLLVNPNDNEAFLRAVNEPPRGIGKITTNHLLVYSRNWDVPIFEVIEKVDDIPEIQTRAKVILKEFAKWIRETKEKLEKKTDIADILIKFIEESGLIYMYEEVSTEESFDRVKNIETLLSDIYDFLNENPDLTLEDYLQQISLISDIDEKNLSEDKVKLMTVHSAKGLEFPVVFVVGLEQGLFPLIRSRNNIEDEEEERRLFYVALTRAKEKVILTYAKNRQRFGVDSYQVPSIFLSEIDKKYIEHPELQSNRYERSYIGATYNSVNNEYDQTGDNELRVGDKVLHPFFGVGWIEKLEGYGSSAQALVSFETVGRKRLMLQYARLKKLNE